MPCGNGLTLSKRKHGVCVPGLGLFSSVLVALCCVEVWGSEPQGCSPCPLNCSCALAGPLQSCVVNCSNIGLEKAPATADLPLATNVLDLSKNHISSIDSSLLDHLTSLRELYLQGNRINILPRGVFCCGPLSVLDLSNNQITTLKERICDNPCNLTQIDLSSNPFDCDCKLFRLVSWLQKKGVRVQRPESMLCNHPPELHQRPLLNISLLTCGMNYAACLDDSSNGAGGRSELVIFSSSTPGNFSREQCTGVCLMSAHRYGGLGARRECLCSTNSEPNFISESQCSAACTNPHVMEKCGWTLADDVFAVDFSVSVKPIALQSVHDQIRFSAGSSVSPVTLSWDFGDRSPRVNTTETETTKVMHKYGLPGQYRIGVTAWIGHKEQVSAQGEVTVTLPPKLQLVCPTLSVINKSLEVSLLSWGAMGLSIDWKISKDRAEVAKASPHCPGGVIHNETSHCFEILTEEMNWTDARHTCLGRGGDLAIVRSETLRRLTSLKVTQERGVWLGLSDVQSPGKLLWVNGSEAMEGEEGPPPRSVIIKGNMCISLDQRGQTSAHPCNIKRAFVCEHKPQVRVPDAGVYMVGLAVFPTHSPLLSVQADPLWTLKPANGAIEMLLFPAMSFVHAGRLSSLELDTLELQRQVQIRFQIYRPHCPSLHLLLPGCGGVACAPVALCVSNSTVIRDPLSCPPLKQWCPFLQQCLALYDPCQPQSCSNCSQAHILPPKTFRPHYTLSYEVVFTVPVGPPAHILIQDRIEDLLVSPGDVFALQHDAGPGSLFDCQPAPHSSWHQAVLAINQSEWFWFNKTGTSEELEEVPIPEPELDLDTLLSDGEARWLQEVTCPVRVLYAGHSEMKLQGEQLTSGLREPGLYNLMVYSADTSDRASDSCLLQVVPPLGLTIIHPTLQNGSIYLQPNDTRILLRVQSRSSTNATWNGTNRTVTFLPTCPPEFMSRPGLCQPSLRSELTEPNQYAVLDLGPGLEEQERPLQLELEAHNDVTEASLSVAVHLEEALLGLLVFPDPGHRVLMESVVSYTASATKGSNPTFKWTVDDKPYFTYYNTVLNVIYQHAAVYKLTVTAMNHVSTITKHFNVTVDRLVPMSNLSVRGVPDVVPQGSTQTFTTSVQLDMSVTATFRWCFGDGGYKEFEYKPPYSGSPQIPDSPNQILLSNNVTYVYSQPGIYSALVSVSNRYENISQTINMSVYSILNHVDIQTEPPLLLAGETAEFEAHPLPSPYGIHYDWHFGDASATLQGRRVVHTYTQSGVFNICVLVNNTISSLTACAEIFVFEKIENLTANSSSPSELHSPTQIWAHITSGNNVTWTFSMGDGSFKTVSEPPSRRSLTTSHYYTTDGNYTVNVTASNAISSVWTLLNIHVFEFQVVHIEPSGCIHVNTPITFQAFVTGNASAHLYEWKFGDNSAIEVRHGNPQVSHMYGASGNFNLSLTISSGVSKAGKDICVCVQPALQNISFTTGKTHYAVEEEIWFEVESKPNFNYSYQWDFGQGDDPVLVQGSGIAVTKFTDPGQYIITVTVFNNISSLNASISIEVQMPIGSIVILHNSTKHNNFTLKEPYTFHTSSMATNVSYTWDFGDGFVQSSASVIHAYDMSGNYNITLTAVNTVSSNQTVLSVAVLAPIRNLTLNSSLINVPLNASVNFEAHMDEGDGVRYSWILCDHCSSIVGTNTMFYTFRSVGTFTIIVTAENDLDTTQASILLFVQRELENLTILREDEIGRGGTPELCCYATNRILHLEAELKVGTNMTFSWNLIREVDPHLSVYNITGKTVDVNFSSPGPCDIVLRAENRLGHLTKNRTIYFLEPVEMVSLKVSKNPVAVHIPIHMTVLSPKGSDLQYRWSINKDVVKWNMSSKSHSFDTPGLKLVEVDVFNEVSTETVSETISVQEIITGLNFTATNMTEQSYVSTGYIVWLQGNVTTGTNITWTWIIDGQTRTGNKTFFIFHHAKQTFISLKASNDISEQVLLSRKVVVQDRISGLELKANSQNVAVGVKVEFNVTLAAGTDAQIVLSISGDNTVFIQPNQSYVHIFTRVDTYMVNVTAHNQVNFKKYSLQVKVSEPIRGLSIKDCCPTAIPVGVKRTFVANILTGSAVSFLWTFDLHHLLKTSHMRKEVSYKPEEPGVLTIYLKAFNNLHDVNTTKHILVQNRLSDATLYATPRDTFINKTVSLRVLVMPRHTPAHCVWELGDGSSGIHADTTIDYIYKQPGHYLVQVNCSNQVSWALGQVEVNITVLECEEPEVQVVQAPRLSIWRTQPTLVEANVDLKGCVRYGEQYLWQILDVPSCDNSEDSQVISEPSLPIQVIPLSKVDMRRLQLSLPKMSLPAGNYSLVFSLSYEGVPLRKAACLQLSVMAAKLVPLIEGGSFRAWSRTQDLQLSAEQSYDPNMPPGSQYGLYYDWKCIGTSEGPGNCSTLNFGLGSSGPVLGISRSELEAGVNYTFKLTISKDGMAPASTTQKVLVKSGPIPIVSLECFSCKAQSFYEVSQNSYVNLKGTCMNCEGFHQWRWSAMTSQNDTLVLDSSSTTTGSHGMNLVLRQGILREGDSYIFTLHVTDSALDGEGAASITLHRNMPPAGGKCHLKAGGDAGVNYTIEDNDSRRIQTLVDRVHFNCSGFSDVGVSETPLLYSLLVTRCKEDYCEDFCVYRGSSPEHAAFLPPGFSASRHRVAVSITVEDHQGATNTAINKSIEVGLPNQPLQYTSLPQWLSNLTDIKLKKLLEQGDSQRVRELSLALITVLNEYEQTRQRESREERKYRVRVRSNITRALTSLDLTTVNDIQQTSAALAQCTAVSREFICEECQNSTLNKLESMLKILQTDTKQGTVTPTEIADNILNIMGDLIHQVSQSASQYVDSPSQASHSSHPILSSPIEDHNNTIFDPLPPSQEPHPVHVAAKAYNLSSMLMLILMHARVLNEEPLRLRGAEIAATGKLADPQSLLCYHGNNSPECQRFSIPRAFNKSLGKAAAGNSIMQLLFQVESNPFPFNYVPNYTVSTEVASMEFRTENGIQIPISGLDDSLAITVAVNNGTIISEGGTDGSSAPGLPTSGSVNISHCDSVIVKVNARNTNRQAGLFVHLNFTSLDNDRDMERDTDQEMPYIIAYLHSHDTPNEFNCTDQKLITLNMTQGSDLDHKKFTFFLSPESYDTTLEYFINVSTPCSHSAWPAEVRLEVGVFASLCQYFNESDKQWRTDGMVPLAETNATRAVCRTRHLTAFAAGLFVPPNAVSFKIPERYGAPSHVVLLFCVLGLLSYVVAAAILHKLDQLDLRRAGVVPLCGEDGLFKYEVQVKTGWSQGAGTTAHVGISLYGRESRSGHRHLDSRGAFTRNALDIFHIATDTNLGSVWKIRIWHDNKGLSPAWLLQYVLVKDLQAGSSYYFLVDDWLSVDNDRIGRKVEIEVEASEDADLRRLPRLLRSELERALCESHLWLSLWERPPRSPFTRLQRATCCALFLQLILMANTLWYSIVVDKRISPRAVSTFSSLNKETVAAGFVVCLVIYPLYLLVFTVFRMSRSKCVTVEQVPAQVDQESVEIDDFLDNSMAGSSFLFFSGETNSEETNVDLPTPSTKSDESSDFGDEYMEDRDWPELMSEGSVVGGAGHGAGLPTLKRSQGSRHLGVDIAFNPDSENGQHNKYFTSSDEDLIKHILADGQNFFPQADESEMADLSSILGDKTEVILLQKLNEPLPIEAVRRDPPKTAFTSNTVVTDVCRPRRFPPWCGRAALWGSWGGISLANFVSIWAGLGFNQKVAMMWLISCFASVLCSCLLLEPMKVICEAVYYALCVRRLRPEDQDVLVEFPRVERVVQRVHHVRPPQGFALSQARHQARKVHMLHTMLKNFLVYMFLLLVVILLNYSDSAKDTHSLRLRTQLQHALHTPEYHNINSREDVITWLNESLLPRLLDDSRLLQDTGSVLLGTIQLQQVHNKPDINVMDDSSVTSSSMAKRINRFGIKTALERGDLIHQLNRSLEEAVSSLEQLQRQNWLNYRTRAVVVDFSLYNINTNLLAVFSFLFHFPVSERAQCSLDLLVTSLWPITGLDLPLLLTMVLLILAMYFLVRGVLGYLRQGYSYLLSSWRVMGVCKLTLALSVCGLHLSRCTMAKQQWASYLTHPQDTFTDFSPLARQSQLFTVMAALLLFILVLKASHQLRFLREWAVFGRTLRRSGWELLSLALALLLLLLTYAHTGHVLFHSVFDGYSSVASACLSLLGTGGRGLLFWKPLAALNVPSSSISTLMFHTSFAILRLLLLWFVITVLLRNYRRARAELYRPAVDLQDYEMVELFLRRLKMWMGLSRAKEFRHKVRFEGMDLPPSRSSSTSDCRSLCLPPLDRPDSPSTPDSVDAGSEASWRPTSSSPCSLTEAPGASLGLGLGLGLGLSPGVLVGGVTWKQKAETEAALGRILPTLDALLQQLDRVTMATEDLYYVECKLEKAQRKRRLRGETGPGPSRLQRGPGEDAGGWRERKSGKEKQKTKKGKKMEKSDAKDTKKTPIATPVPFLKSKSVSSHPALNSMNKSTISIQDHISAPHRTASNKSTPAPVLCTPTLSVSGPSTCTSTPTQPGLSSLFNHPAHTTTIPTRKRKRKPPPLKNKVHPN